MKTQGSTTETRVKKKKMASRKRSGGKRGKCIFVSGQVGVHKTDMLHQAAELASSALGKEVLVFDVGQRMYEKLPDVMPGRILCRPSRELRQVRRELMNEAIALVRKGKYVVINTHFCFLWHRGLEVAVDNPTMKKLNPDLFVSIIDNFHHVYANLLDQYPFLEDGHYGLSFGRILQWRDCELALMDSAAGAPTWPSKHYVLARGREYAKDQRQVEILSKLFQEGIDGKVALKWYPSFPISHVRSDEDLRVRIDAFKAELAEKAITFEPDWIYEKELICDAKDSKKKGRKKHRVVVNGRELRLPVDQLLAAEVEVDTQIVHRDERLINQCHGIISIIPEHRKTNKPVISSGVERELQHAREQGRYSVVLWIGTHSSPSPFVTVNADLFVRDEKDLIRKLEKRKLL